MARRTLSLVDDGQSAKVTLPKGDLDRDGLVDENGEIRKTLVNIDRIGEREFVIELADPDEM